MRWITGEKGDRAGHKIFLYYPVSLNSHYPKQEGMSSSVWKPRFQI